MHTQTQTRDPSGRNDLLTGQLYIKIMHKYKMYRR